MRGPRARSLATKARLVGALLIAVVTILAAACEVPRGRIAVDQAGRIYLTDPDFHRVIRVDNMTRTG